MIDEVTMNVGMRIILGRASRRRCSPSSSIALLLSWAAGSPGQSLTQNHVTQKAASFQASDLCGASYRQVCQPTPIALAATH